MHALTDRLVDLAWVRLPLAGRYVSRSLAHKAADGQYLAAWPLAGALLPPLALLLGLGIGWQHWGFAAVFSESMAVMMVACALGLASAQLGLLFVVGFALGDFFLSGLGWSPLLRLRVPALIEYALLGALATTVPVLTKTLLAPLVPPAALPRAVRFGVAVLGHVLLTCGMVKLWVEIVPILIRPTFTWLGSAPTVAAMAPLQGNGTALVWLAGVVSLGRMAMQGLTASRPTLGARLDVLGEKLAAAPPVRPLVERVPLPVRVAGTTLWSVLLLAGMLQFWVDAVLLGVLMAVLFAARLRLLPVPLGPWPRLAERVPLLIRYAVGFGLIYVLSDAILSGPMGNGTTFRPIVLLVGVALVVMFLLAPGVGEERGEA